jgi:hypothetical protein
MTRKMLPAKLRLLCTKLFNPRALHLLHFLNPNSYADKFGVRVANCDAIVGHLPFLIICWLLNSYPIAI